MKESFPQVDYKLFKELFVHYGKPNIILKGLRCQGSCFNRLLLSSIDFYYRKHSRNSLGFNNGLLCPNCIIATIFPHGKSGSVTPTTTVTPSYTWCFHGINNTQCLWTNEKLQYKGTIVLSMDKRLLPWEQGELKVAKREAKVFEWIMRSNSQRN